MAFGTDKRYALLGFLAYAGEWVGRDRLAFLFWPDVTSSTSRSRLRQLLRRVRALDWVTGLESERTRVRWVVETDVASFETALEENDWQRAFDLYEGPLLDGITRDDVPEFAAWLDYERATLHDRWRSVLFEQAGRLGEDEGHRPVIPLLAALLRTDEFDEEALRAYMTASFHAGQRLRALETYRGFEVHLRDELGLEPALATQRLAQSIRRPGANPPPPMLRGPLDAAGPLSSAAPASAFVGRDEELRSVAASLSRPGCRMLTLVGLGGVGKSRIALEMCHAWHDPAHFVRLDGLANPASIPAAITDVVGCTPRGGEDPVAQLVSHIGRQRMLLVLDDYEQLTEGADLVSKMLRACPSLSVLVTSRERLGVPEEWVYEVPGLSFPALDAPLERAGAYDAVRLFTARAEQVREGYRLSAGDLPHVLRICRLVQGLPLGLELAAAWMRSATAEAIADEIAANVDFLRRRNSAERHESIRAVFENSWRMLTREEQQVLATLSVFRGGFTRDAARTVAHASTPVLSALVDKSLLQLLPSGRYERHPLLYQYVSEKHQAYEDREASHRRHARHFLVVAENIGAKLRTTRDVGDLDVLEADHENLRKALRWGLAHDTGLAVRLAGVLGRFWEIRGHLLEACEWLEASLSSATDVPTEVEARALDALGRLLYLRGDRASAEPRIRAALACWRRVGDDHGISSALNHLGVLAMDQGEFARAEELYREALASCLSRNDRTGVAYLLNNLGEVARLHEDYAWAEERYQESLAMHRAAGNQRGTAITLGNLGFVVHAQGRPGQAAASFDESIALKYHLGDEIGMAYCFVGLAGILCDVGTYATAARLLGVAERMMQAHSVALDAADRSNYEANVAGCRANLGDDTFAAMAESGRTLDVEAAVDLAREAGTEAVGRNA